MNRYSLSIILAASAVFFGCTPALPGAPLSEEVGSRALAAGEAAKAAEASALRAEEYLAESRRLHAQALELVEQAHSARRYCESVQKKIPKQRVIYIEKKKKKKTSESEDEEEPEEEKPKELGPKYSPSDAPLNAPPAKAPAKPPAAAPES